MSIIDKIEDWRLSYLEQNKPVPPYYLVDDDDVIALANECVVPKKYTLFAGSIFDEELRSAINRKDVRKIKDLLSGGDLMGVRLRFHIIPTPPEGLQLVPKAEQS